MSVPLTINGATFDYPVNLDENWGVNATGWAQAVTSGMLQMAGGNFPLTAQVDFGSSFGIKVINVTSKTANPATTGYIRLAKTDAIDFRNNANSANLPLAIDGSDILTFNGVPLATNGGGTVNSGTTGKLAYYATNGTTLSPSTNFTYDGNNIITLSSGRILSSVTIPTNAYNLAFYGASGVGTNITFQAPSSITNTQTYILPAIAGTSSQVLQTNGSDSLSWATVGSVNSGIASHLAYYASSTNTISSNSTLSISGGILSGQGILLSGGLEFSNHGQGLIFDGNTGSDQIFINAPAFTGGYFLTLPAAQGAANSVLVNDGSGNLSWEQPFPLVSADPGSPTEGQVWYNTTTHLWKGYNGSAVRTFTTT